MLKGVRQAGVASVDYALSPHRLWLCCDVSMVHKNRSQIRDIQDRIGRVLMDEWDPIGVNGIPEAAGEYDRYIGAIYGMIQRRASEHDISAHLLRLEIDEMGMVNAAGLPPRTEKRDAVAASLRGLFS